MAARPNHRTIEMRNRLDLINLAYQVGYNSYLPVVDEGIDLILYRESDGEVRKVQQKGRWTINKKYEGRDIWIAFPNVGTWYMARHDELVDISSRLGFAARSTSWREKGEYSRDSLSVDLKEMMRPFVFPPQGRV